MRRCVTSSMKQGLNICGGTDVLHKGVGIISGGAVAGYAECVCMCVKFREDETKLEKNAVNGVSGDGAAGVGVVVVLQVMMVPS